MASATPIAGAALSRRRDAEVVDWSLAWQAAATARPWRRPNWRRRSPTCGRTRRPGPSHRLPVLLSKVSEPGQRETLNPASTRRRNAPRSRTLQQAVRAVEVVRARARHDIELTLRFGRRLATDARFAAEVAGGVADIAWQRLRWATQSWQRLLGATADTTDSDTPDDASGRRSMTRNHRSPSSPILHTPWGSARTEDVVWQLRKVWNTIVTVFAWHHHHHHHHHTELHNRRSHSNTLPLATPPSPSSTSWQMLASFTHARPRPSVTAWRAAWTRPPAVRPSAHAMQQWVPQWIDHLRQRHQRNALVKWPAEAWLQQAAAARNSVLSAASVTLVAQLGAGASAIDAGVAGVSTLLTYALLSRVLASRSLPRDWFRPTTPAPRRPQSKSLALVARLMQYNRGVVRKEAMTDAHPLPMSALDAHAPPVARSTRRRWPLWPPFRQALQAPPAPMSSSDASAVDDVALATTAVDGALAPEAAALAQRATDANTLDETDACRPSTVVDTFSRDLPLEPSFLQKLIMFLDHLLFQFEHRTFNVLLRASEMGLFGAVPALVRRLSGRSATERELLRTFQRAVDDSPLRRL
ncbi:hypothetical protein CDCA_CDCA19G4638 [Cyanidium caldarium]|uniref:Uncharacterized protein n=1 Tax=Cyanidium caldarium TaxID=2771 RepID=A0AAV9J2N7_CYACA|nr:hypothetical protein CDCA_CDCA19G4638 [Cyanidium caldarium]